VASDQRVSIQTPSALESTYQKGVRLFAGQSNYLRVVELLFAVGIFVSIFVGFNIGGSSTGVAFGPAVGSELVSKLTAAGLMTSLPCWVLGRRAASHSDNGWTNRPRELVYVSSQCCSIVFVGLALLISNTFGVPASTSMTAVGAIAGLGLASRQLNEAVMLEIVSW